MHSHHTSFSPSGEAPGPIVLGTIRGGPALEQIDTVAERLAIASARTVRERRLGALLDAQIAMLPRCATHAARARTERRIGELVEAIGQLMAEHAAELDGAARHLAWARQSARIDAFVADRARLDSAGMVGVA